MESSEPLSVVDRFAQIIDGLCALLIAQLVPRTWVGRLFGGPSRRLVLRFCADLKWLSDWLRVIAAGIAADRPVMPPPRVDDSAWRGDADPERSRLRRRLRDARGRAAPIVAMTRPTCRASHAAIETASPCARTGDGVAAMALADHSQSAALSPANAAGVVFRSMDGAAFCTSYSLR